MLAHAMLFMLRGVPTVYYGDEQGFVGQGGDQDARQDMFARQVASYNEDTLLGTSPTDAQANFDPAIRFTGRSLTSLKSAPAIVR